MRNLFCIRLVYLVELSVCFLDWNNSARGQSKLPKTRAKARVIISPFAQTTSTVRRRPAASSGSLGALDRLEPAGPGGPRDRRLLHLQVSEDPYRTLEPFPMDKYLADYRSMAGNKFKADLKVSADLGWKAETGRLMVFTCQNDNRPLVVLIPPKLERNLFTKGQNYQVSLEVGEGGTRLCRYM